MAVKFDKDLIIKNRFWIILSVTVCLAVFGLVYLQSINADEAAKKYKAMVDLAQKQANEPTKGRVDIEAIAKVAESAKGNEAIVWGKAWQAQAKLYQWPKKFEDEYDFQAGKFANEISLSKPPETWPEDTEHVKHGILTKVDLEWIKIKDRKGKEEMFRRTGNAKITLAEENKTPLWEGDFPAHEGKLAAVKFQVGRYFDDMLTRHERDWFGDVNDDKKGYKTQIHDILKIVEPVDVKGNGVVQLKNWLYRPDEYPEESMRFIRYVKKDWDSDSDFSQETWIAQEDLWIQTEIYRIIKEINDEVKVFQPTKGGEKRGQPYTFKNTNFELELILFPDDTLSFKIKNLQSRRQKLDVSFRVELNNGPGHEPEVIRISGTPLMPKGGKGDFRVDTIPVAKDGKSAPRKGIYKVEQVMTWESAAVKRIDQVSIGSNAGGDVSHGNRTFGDALVPFKKPPEDAKAVKKADGNDPLAGGGGFKAVDAPGGGGNRVATKHGLWTNRYTEVTNVSRRLPVGVVLIVDQDYVDRALTAFNNSKLRFLESHVLLNHYTGSLQPLLPDEKKEAVGGGAVEGGVAPPRFIPGLGVVGGGAKTGTQTGGGGQGLETNMELVIYGVVTIYHRHPPRPRDEKKE